MSARPISIYPLRKIEPLSALHDRVAEYAVDQDAEAFGIGQRSNATEQWIIDTIHAHAPTLAFSLDQHQPRPTLVHWATGSNTAASRQYWKTVLGQNGRAPASMMQDLRTKIQEISARSTQSRQDAIWRDPQNVCDLAQSFAASKFHLTPRGFASTLAEHDASWGLQEGKHYHLGVDRSHDERCILLDLTKLPDPSATFAPEVTRAMISHLEGIATKIGATSSDLTDLDVCDKLAMDIRASSFCDALLLRCPEANKMPFPATRAEKLQKAVTTLRDEASSVGSTSTST